MGTETKCIPCLIASPFVIVEKMGPLRGDGNGLLSPYKFLLLVEKMGPLRGDGNTFAKIAKLQAPV